MSTEPGREVSGIDEAAGGDRSAPIDRLAIAVTLAAIVLAAIAILSIPALRDAFGQAISGDTSELESQLKSLGAAGVAILYALIIVHTVVWYPAEIVNAASGFVYGFWGGLALVMTGWVVQAVIAWAIGREVARPLLRRLIGERRYDRAEKLIADGGVPLLLAMRLIPIVPFSLFSYVAGAARVPLGRFAWTTAVGYLPITAIFVYLGTQLDSLSLTDPLLLGGAVVIVVLLALARPASRRFGA